jgi:hypothetical protein
MAKKVIHKKTDDKNQRIHSWRLCPYGRHWVREHSMHTPPSNKNPGGSTTIRHAHCANNPSGKDQLYPDEIQEMAQKNFSQVKERPCPLDLGFKRAGTQYDDLIAGWTIYWNDVLSPREPLSPNIVKALIASESGFNSQLLAKKENSNSARGLMQILNSTRKTLGDEKGELRDHFLTVTKDELNDPSVNICAGIRWLFQKQELASSHLGRESSWEEAVMNYKGKLKSKPSDIDANKQKKIFKKYLDALVKCEAT